MTPARGWVLYACRTTYAVEVAEVIWRLGDEVGLLVDNMAEGGSEWAGEGRATAEIEASVVPPAALTPDRLRLPVALPLITPGHRFALEAEARAFGLESFPALVDPTAIVARTASVGEGTVVNAAAVIGGGAEIGRFVHVNRGSSIGHHDLIEDFATLGPGCVLAGSVRVARGAFVGAGAVCAPEIAIGPNAVVGAGAVVVRDVPAGKVVVGNPARVVRECAGYGDVSVPAAASGAAGAGRA